MPDWETKEDFRRARDWVAVVEWVQADEGLGQGGSA